MPHLGNAPTLADLQAYVTELERERGFAHETLLQKCLLLGEEVGELFKSVRKQQGLAVEEGRSVSAAADELADVLVLICAVANRLGVDLEAAFRAKEVVNHRRSWKRDVRPSPGTEAR